jgi:YbbR domain-containing protein
MKKFFRQYVVHNFGLKLFSLLLATGLWLAVTRDRPAEVALDVPIEFHNVSDNLEIVTEHIPQAQIRVRGAARLIRRLQSSDVHTEVDLSGLRAGERTFDLTLRQVHLPPGLDRDLEVVQVIPSQLHLTFDTRLFRQVPVQPRVVGSFASGLAISQVVVDPAVVTIVGPRQRVESVEAAITDAIDASGVMDRAIFFRHPYVSDPLIQVTDSDPARVTIIMRKGPPGSGGH